MDARIGVCVGSNKDQQPVSAGGRNPSLAWVLASAVCIALLLSVVAVGQTITTIAGGGPAPNGISATGVPIGTPWGVVQDASGNTYISDTQSNRIFKIASGKISVFAGSILNNYTGDGGLATAATLSSPQGIALDANTGALYIADTGNNVIRVINTSASDITLFTGTLVQLTIHAGDIATVAGDSVSGNPCVPSGSGPQCGDGGFVNSSLLNAPAGLFVDASGNVFVADTGDSVIREVVVSGPNNGKIELVAGNYVACASSGVGVCGDAGAATSAQLKNPAAVWVDASDNIYLADTNDSAIRVVNQTGGPITIAGVTIPAGDIETVAGTIGTACTTGPVDSCSDGSAGTSALLNFPDGVFVDASGNIFVADTGDFVVREVSTAGTITLQAGSYVSGFAGDGQAPVGAQTQLSSPTSVFVTSSAVLIADQSNNAIREVVGGVTGTISSAFGVGLNSSYYGDGGPGAPNAEVLNSQGVAADSAGNVYIADTDNNVIRKVSTSGTISTVAGNGSQCIQANFPCGDGAAATAAQLNRPEGVFIDGAGNIFIADTHDNVIREVVSSTGKIQAVVGTEAAFPCTPGTPPTCGDGGVAASAQLNFPSAVFVDNSGDIYIADANSNVIRVVNNQAKAATFAGVSIAKGDIQTVAGKYTPCSSAPCGDGGSATKAQLNFPDALFVDSSDNIFISDNGDFVIRKVDGKTGTITNVAGNYAGCSAVPCGDGGKATSAQFSNAFGLWVDFVGNIFIADAGRASIRAVNTTGSSVTIAGTTIAPGDIDRVVGTAVPGYSGDNGPAANAQLDRPHALAGDFAGNLFITDTANQRVRKVSKLLATAPATFTLPASGTLSPASLTAGASASGTVTVTSVNSFSAAVSLTCAVTPTGTKSPTCSLSKSSVTPAVNGTATSTLTVDTTATTAALVPASKRQSNILFATILLPAMLGSTAGLGRSKRKKLISMLLLILTIAGCLFLVACGGGSSSTPPPSGGGSTGTPSGQYTITVTATSGAITQTQAFTLTVQ